MWKNCVDEAVGCDLEGFGQAMAMRVGRVCTTLSKIAFSSHLSCLFLEMLCKAVRHQASKTKQNNANSSPCQLTARAVAVCS